MKARVALFGMTLAAAAAAFPQTLCAVTVREWKVQGLDAATFTAVSGVMYSPGGKVEIGYDTAEVRHEGRGTLWTAAGVAGEEPLIGGGSPVALLQLKEGELAAVDLDDNVSVAGASVTALARLASGSVVAGISGAGLLALQPPGGGEFKVVSKLPCTNVWDILDTGDGSLLVATGPRGQLFRVDAKTWTYEEWAQAADTNLTALHRTAAGEILVGGGELGNLYRLEGRGRLSTVAHFAEHSIRRIVPLGTRALVAADVLRTRTGEKAAEQFRKFYDVYADLKERFGTAFQPPLPVDELQAQLADLGDGALYAVGRDGDVERVHAFTGESVLDVAVEGGDNVLVATAPQGRVYLVRHALGPEREVLVAQDFDYTSVTRILVRDGEPAVFLAAGNRTVAFRRKPGLAARGLLDTTVFDAGQPAAWGALAWTGDGLAVSSRHGNTPRPDATWTAWTPRRRGEPGEIPRETWRYVQVRFELTGKGRLENFTYRFLEKNARPTLADLRSTRKDGRDGPLEVTWSATDPNQDRLGYRLWLTEQATGIRVCVTGPEPVAEAKATVLSAGFPDGRYRLTVEATDEQANPGAGLTAALSSDGLIVDNTPPAFRNVKFAGGKVAGEVSDGASTLAKLEYSADGGPWRDLAPEDGILDQRSEGIALRVDAARGWKFLALRVADAAGNTAGLLVRLGGAPAP